MSELNLTTSEISVAVDRSLKDRGWTILDCCQAYNAAQKGSKPLQKDFVQRIRKNKFSVISDRVVDLCRFLQIETDRPARVIKLQQELEAVEALLKSNPSLEPKVKKLLNNLLDIIGAQ